MNALSAYDRGLSGQGVTIAVIDSGLTVTAETQGRVSSDSRSFPFSYARCGTCPPETVTYTLDDVVGHGSRVASVAAAARDAQGIAGVAPAATIMALKIGSGDLIGIGDKPAGTHPVEVRDGPVNTAQIDEALAHAVERGAFVINMSLGASAAAFAPERDARLAAMDAARVADRLVVKAVANSVGPAGTEDGLPQDLLGPDLRNKDWFLYAIRVDKDLRPPNGGNGTPGALADRTLSVVAEGIQAVGPDGQVTTVTGNSFAAPAVSGAAALLKQHWPQLGGRAIARILLDSARDLGAPGVDPVFGKGLLDLGEALKAQAPMVGTSLAAAVPVAGTAVTTGGAFGGTKGAAGFVGLVSVDAYGRDYRTDLSVLAHAGPSSLRLGDLSQPTRLSLAPVTPDRAMGLRDTGGARDLPGSARFALGGTTVGLDVNAATVRAAHLSLTGDPLRVAGLTPKGSTVSVERGGWRAGFARGNTPTGSVERASLAYAPLTGVEVEVTSVRERGAALGLVGTGAFAVDGASTRLASVALSRSVGGIDLTGRMTVGTASIDTPGTSLLALGEVALSAFALTAGYSDASGGRWTLGLSSPLRADRAVMSGALPVGFDRRLGEVVTANRALDFSAGARELDLEAAYTLRVAGGQVSLGAAHALNSGHVEGRTSTAAFARFATSF